MSGEHQDLSIEEQQRVTVLVRELYQTLDSALDQFGYKMPLPQF